MSQLLMLPALTLLLACGEAVPDSGVYAAAKNHDHHASASYGYDHFDDYKHQDYHVPMPYYFSYGVKDDHYYNHFGHEEESDGKGGVKGIYYVLLPEGKKQVVKYYADPYNGYQADVSYEGVYGKGSHDHHDHKYGHYDHKYDNHDYKYGHYDQKYSNGHKYGQHGHGHKYGHYDQKYGHHDYKYGDYGHYDHHDYRKREDVSKKTDVKQTTGAARKGEHSRLVDGAEPHNQGFIPISVPEAESAGRHLENQRSGGNGSKKNKSKVIQTTPEHDLVKGFTYI